MRTSSLPRHAGIAVAALTAVVAVTVVTDPAQAGYDDPTGRIFFQSDRDGNPHVYSMNPDGTDLTRLTSSGGNVSPAVSPGGTRVAWVHDGDVWTMGVDGTERQRVTRTPSAEESPTWSPDGTRLAWVSRSSPDGGNDQEVWVGAADGTGTPLQVTTNTFPDIDPAWSPVLEGAPDGLIAFASARTGDVDRNVYVMEPDGGAARSLTPAGEYGGLPYQGHDDDPAWSGDGRIAYTHTFEPNAGGLPAVWSVGADGTGLRRVSTDPSQSATEPSWSPDALSIAYVGTSGTDRNIGVMAADGTGGRQVDTAPSHDLAPDWRLASTPVAATLATDVAATVRIGLHRGRVPVALTAGPVGSEVALAASVRRDGRWVRVGRATHVVASDERVRVLVPVTRKWRRALENRRVRAQLVTTLTTPADTTVRRVEKFRLIG